MEKFYKFDNKQSLLEANKYARQRGYADFASIKDPLLKEYVWKLSSQLADSKVYISVLMLFGCTVIILSFLFGMLIGLTI